MSLQNSARFSRSERNRVLDSPIVVALLSAFLLLATLAGSAFAAPAREDRILIGLKPGFPAGRVAEFHTRSRTRLLHHFRSMNDLQVIELPPGLSAADAIASYQGSGMVEFAEPDFWISSAATPNDPALIDGSQWYYHNLGQSGGVVGADIHALEAWDTLHAATNVIIAIIDTGLRANHEDLLANLWTNSGEIPGNGLDDDGDGIIDDVHGLNAASNSGDITDLVGHGTQVAGVMGADGNNGLGIVGMAWSVQLMSCRYVDDSGNGSLSDLIQCFDYARDKGAKVINASFVSTDYSASLLVAINSCRSAGIVVVAAAGNSAANNDANPNYPGSFNLDNIVTVAASTRSDTLADYSGYGATTVDLAAPGNDIATTSIRGTGAYTVNSGTSFSTAMVSGALALLRARFPLDTPKQLIDRMLSTVDPLPALTGKCVSGGRLNLARALGPSAVADFTSARSGDSESLLMQFTDTSFGDLNHWTWNFGDGTGSTNQSPLHFFSAQGTYSVSLITSTPLGVLSTTNHAVVAMGNYHVSGGSYSWVTPSSKDSLALGNDGVSAALTLPFLFKFYGETYTQVYIGANGLMGFNSNQLSASLNTALPDPASPNNILCPFWDDLNAIPATTIDSGAVGVAPQRRFVVSWNGVSTVGARPTPLTFQVVLEETSNRILFQYQDVAPTSKSTSAAGKSATIGVEHSSGLIAAQYSFNGGRLLTNSQTLVFTPPLSAPPVLVALGVDSDSHLRFRVTGEAGQIYVLEATGDFSAWTSVVTNTAGVDGVLGFVEPLDPRQPRRFYRVLSVR